MIGSAILSRYIGRQFVVWFLMLLGVLLGLILLLDTAELLRRATHRASVTLPVVFQMALFKLPGIGQQVLPFAVLFSAMFTFWKMTRSQELVVARAIGVSVWRFTRPVLLAAIGIGVITVTVVNPIGSVLVARYEKLEDKHFRNRGSTLNVSGSGLWLRQNAEDGQYLIHAETVVAARSELLNVTVFVFKEEGEYTGRIDAPKAWLEPGRWRLRDGWYNRPDKASVQYAVFDIPTDFTLNRIEDHFAPPKTVSFWKLPRFIETLEATGFSAIRHRLHFQSLLAQPLLFCAMVLFAATFSLRLPRRGGILIMVSAGVFTGFMLFVVTDVVLTIGVTGAIPVFMAAWMPTGISLLLGTSLLLHLEDG